MHKDDKPAIKSNKPIILTSVVASLLTMIVIFSLFAVLIFSNTISINGLNQRGLIGGNTEPIKTGSAAEQSEVINTVEKANPAVVSIIISKNVSTAKKYNNIYDYLLNNPNNQQDSTEKQQIGGGSGFFVTADGYIVTNRHVVKDDTAEYTVLTKDGKKFNAKIIAKDETLDVAVLKVDGKDFSYLTFADSDTIKLGQTAIAIGNALAEFQNSISMGIVSGLARSITAGDGSGSSERLDDVIQTDAAINHGNSGGPLLDIKGNVIGVNVAIGNEANSIGFALPSNIVKEVADSVIKTGSITRPYLGVRYIQINDDIKKKNNLSVDYGVLVARGAAAGELAVLPGSPADKSGIVENDIILEIDGVKIDQNKSLASMIRQKKVDQTITLKVMHDGKTKEVQVKLEKAPNKG